MIIFLFFGFLTIIQACKNKSDQTGFQDTQMTKDALIQEKYNVLLEYKNLEKDEIKGDFIYLFFETDFDNDFVEVFSNGKKEFSDTITTDHSLGLAEDIELGRMSDINEIYFRINNGKDVVIRNINYNSLKINYIKDSIVLVEFSNRFEAYY